MPTGKHRKSTHSQKKQKRALQDLSNIFASSVVSCSQRECKDLFDRIDKFNSHLQQQIEGVASFHMETSAMSLCNSEVDSGIVFEEEGSCFRASPRVATDGERGKKEPN